MTASSSAPIVAFHIYTKLVASMTLAEGPFHVPKVTTSLGKKYDKRLLKVMFCVVF